MSLLRCPLIRRIEGIPGTLGGLELGEHLQTIVGLQGPLFYYDQIQRIIQVLLRIWYNVTSKKATSPAPPSSRNE